MLEGRAFHVLCPLTWNDQSPVLDLGTTTLFELYYKISFCYLNYITKFEGIKFLFKKVMQKKCGTFKDMHLKFLVIVLKTTSTEDRNFTMVVPYFIVNLLNFFFNKFIILRLYFQCCVLRH